MGIILLWTVHKEKSKGFKIALTVIFAIWLLILFGANNSSKNNSDTEEVSTETVEEEPTEEDVKEETSATDESTKEDTAPTKVLNEDEFVEAVKEAIQDDVNTSNGEKIQDVVLENRDLCVYVDFSEIEIEHSDILSEEDVATSRVSSITDTILQDFSDYDDLWDTVTIDFGDLGRVTCGKDDIKNDGFGRYFTPHSGLDFVLTPTGERPENDNQTGESNHPEKVDEYGTVTYMKLTLDKVVGGYDIPLATQSWTMAWFDSEGAIIAMTDISPKGGGLKETVIGVFSPTYYEDKEEIQGGTTHYLSIGDNVIIDDGYCDEIFEKIGNLSGAFGN